MSIFKKIKSTFDVAREMGVDENKIKELKKGERHIEGETMDKVLQSINKSKVERDIEKLNIFEWYKNTDLKELRMEFGYRRAKYLADELNIPISSMNKFENKKFDKVNKLIIKLYDFYHNDFNKKLEEKVEPIIKEEKREKNINEKNNILDWYYETDFAVLRENYTQKKIAEIIGVPQSSWCEIENHKISTCSKNMIKIYNYYHQIAPQSLHNSEDIKSDENINPEVIVNAIVDNSESSIFDGVAANENSGICNSNAEKDMTSLYEHIDKLKNRIQEQDKEISKLKRQVYYYEKLIDRL